MRLTAECLLENAVRGAQCEVRSARCAVGRQTDTTPNVFTSRVNSQITASAGRHTSHFALRTSHCVFSEWENPGT